MIRRVLLVALLVIAGGGAAGAQQAIGAGDWIGSLLLRRQPVAPGQSGGSESYTFALAIHILPENRGITVDIPEQGMYSYPIDRYSFDEKNISFVMDALGADEELTFSGGYSESFAPQGSSQKGGIVGSVKGRSWTGSFHAQKLNPLQSPGELSVDIAIDGGSLPATLTFPARAKPELDAASPQDFPLVILVAGAGKTDRNGNNVDVPGKTDTLKQLAQALRQRGVGTLRYDRRGTGEAYRLETPGQMTSFSQQVKDLAQVIARAAALPRRGRLIVAGMNEGAWMASAALGLLGPDIEVDGLIVLDASGVSPMETLEQSTENLSADLKAKALEAANTLVSTGTLIDVPSELADFFSPNRAAWLATWLAFDPAAALREVEVPVLLVYGTQDMQVERSAFSRLIAAKPDAVVRVVPDMNYALKEVRSEDENYAAFTDPSFKVPALLTDLLASYAKAQPAPQGLLPWTQ